MKKLTEKDIEDVFEIFHSQLLEPNLKLLKRQQTIKEHNVRFDLLFRDKNGKKLILELKRNAISRDDIGQAIQYAGVIRDSRVVLAAPIIPATIKRAFEHYGIEYLEFDLAKIDKLYKLIKSKNLTSKKGEDYNLIVNPIKIPLNKHKVIDGNVAFKVTYNDKNWCGICSSNIADFNIKNRTWCGIQAKFEYNCQSKKAKKSALWSGKYPCFDAGALDSKEAVFYAGHYHGKKHNNEPKRVWNIKKGKLAIFTSREPGEKESERFIFYVGPITDIVLQTDSANLPFETYHSNKKNGIEFKKDNYPKYWDFYNNPNKPNSKKWSTGLIRYWSDKQSNLLLNWALQNCNRKRVKRAKQMLELI